MAFFKPFQAKIFTNFVKNISHGKTHSFRLGNEATAS